MEEQFQIQPELTAVALGYINKKLIAGKIFPKVDVTGHSFEYSVYDIIRGASMPETKVGPKGSANEVENIATQVAATVEDHSLKDKIPLVKLQDAQKKDKDIRGTVTMQIVNSLETAREINLSKKLSDAKNYAKDNVYTLDENEKFGSAKSTATDIIEDYMNKVLGGANTMILSKRAFSKLRRDRSVINSISINRNATQTNEPGMVSLEAIKDLFQLENIYIGQSVLCSSQKGETQFLSACWKDDVMLLNIDPIATTDYGLTYGYSAVYEDYTVGSYFDPDSGLKGCEVIRPYAAYIDLIACKNCGALLKDVI